VQSVDVLDACPSIYFEVLSHEQVEFLPTEYALEDKQLTPY